MPNRGLPPGLGLPAERALQAAGIETLLDVAELSEADIRGLHGVGPRAIGLLREALALRGLSFRSEGSAPL